MAVYRYPPEVHEFVKTWARKLRDDDLAEECNKALGTNFNATKMKAFRANHKYYNGKKQWTSEEYWKYQKRYPQGMYEFIRDNSWGVSSREMAEMVNEKFGTNWTQTGMKQFRQRHGIKSGVTGWYQKGHPPGTKGKKQTEFCSPEAIERSKKTRFKKGQKPPNTLPVGSITVVEGYKLIKVSMEGSRWDMWKPLHRYVWEQNHGEIPKGMRILFKDGDHMNCDIENLVLITGSESCMMTKRHYRSSDPDVTMAGLNVARLRIKRQQLRKKGRDETGNS